MVRPTRVLIVDDAPQVRQELGRLLALACPMEVVGEAADGLEAVAQAAALGPDVVLLDLELRGWMASRPAVKPSRVIKERGLAGAVVLTIRVDLTSAQAAWAEPVALLLPSIPYNVVHEPHYCTRGRGTETVMPTLLSTFRLEQGLILMAKHYAAFSPF